MVREMLPLAEIYVYEDDYTGEKEFVMVWRRKFPIYKYVLCFLITMTIPKADFTSYLQCK